MFENMFVASLDGEIFDCEEFKKKEDAIKFLKELAEEEPDNPTEGYIGQVELYIPNIDTNSLLEQLGQEAYSEVGDYAETYLEDVQKEHLNELDEKLNEVLSDWIKKYKYEPNFSKVKNVRMVDISLEGKI